MTDVLLRLLGDKVDPASIKKVSGRHGGEYHSPCPICGGTDRFVTFPEQQGGELCQKHGVSGTWACPRHCEKGGDVLSFLTEVNGLTFSAACAELGMTLDGKERRRGYRPLRQRSSGAAPAFAPCSYQPPADAWRVQATKLATEAHERLLQIPSILHYLEQRGLPESAVRAYRLGYIEAESKQQDCIFRSRAAFGLPEKTGANGKPIRAMRIPRGITIPAWAADASCLRLRIRRRNVDIDPNNPKDPKYLLVAQPGQPYSAPLLLPPVGVPAKLATWLIVESELDAMAVHHACGGKVGVLSVLTVRVKPDQAAHAALLQAARILVALDFDQPKADGKNPGADAWPWWEKTYPQARLWPVPEGKDPGEAFALGVDLREWAFMGLPLLPAAQRVPAAPLPPSCGQPVPVKTETLLPYDGALGASSLTPSAARVAGRCWPVPEVTSLWDIELPTSGRVKIIDLAKAIQKRAHGKFPYDPLEDPDCLVPCPRTKPSPFWWGYAKYCHKCKGHPLCLLGVIRSAQFQEVLCEIIATR